MPRATLDQKFKLTHYPNLRRLDTLLKKRIRRASGLSVVRRLPKMRRFTRLTNAFLKKIENHIAAISLHYMHYNFCRVHQTLRVTRAMAAGIADHVWSIEELVGMLAG
jgi:hypothetical protein